MNVVDPSLFDGPVASTSRGVYTLAYDPAEGSDEEDLIAGRDLFEQAWTPCAERIHSILDGLHDACLDQLLSFVAASHSGQPPSLLAVLNARKPIRTGLIIGAASGSSSLLFSTLCRNLTSGWDNKGGSEANEACLVTRIASRDCGTIKLALRAIVAGFIGQTEDDLAEPDVEDDEADEPIAKSSTVPPEDLQNLVAWYAARAKKKVKNPDATLVLLLEDLEGMDSKILTQLCDILSHFAQTLPIVLLIGVATSANALDELLLRRSLDLLELQSFHVEPGIHTFNALMQGLFVNWDAPLRLAVRTYPLLVNMFTDLHLSIDATVSALKVLFMHHFSSKPYSVFTLSTSAPDDVSLEQDRQAILSLPSYKSLSVSSPTSPLLSELSSDSVPTFLESLDRCRSEKDRWTREGRLAWGVVKFLRQHYNLGGKGGVWEKDEEIMEDWLGGTLGSGMDKLLGKSILHSSETSLTRLLDGLLSHLVDHHNAYPSDPTDLHTALNARHVDLSELLSVPRGAGRNHLVNTNVQFANGLYDVLPERSLVEGDRVFSKMVKEVEETIVAWLRHALRPYTELLLHELWFLNDTKPVTEVFIPAPLPLIQRRLLEADADLGECEQHSRLDIAVAFRLYRDTGRNINLGDWWQSFEGAAAPELGADDHDSDADDSAANGVEGTDEEGRKGEMQERKGRKRDRKGKAKAVLPAAASMASGDDELEESEGEEGDGQEAEDGEDGVSRRKQARFLRAVGDLAYAGFLQPKTGASKPEHVVKSVF